MANKTPLWPGGPNIYENVQGDLAKKLQDDVTTLESDKSSLQESVAEKTQTINSLNNKIQSASGKITELIGTLDETDDVTLIASSLNEIYSVLNPN